MKTIYICKMKNENSNYEFVSMVFTNKKAAERWLKLEKEQRNKDEKSKDWIPFFYKDIAYSKCPF